MSILRFQQWFWLLSAAVGMQDCFLYPVCASYSIYIYISPGLLVIPHRDRLHHLCLHLTCSTMVGWLHAIHPKFIQVLQLENHRWSAISGYIPPIPYCCRWCPQSMFCQPALVAEVSKCSTASAKTASRNCRGWGGPWWSCERVMAMGRHQNSW